MHPAIFRDVFLAFVLQGFPGVPSAFTLASASPFSGPSEGEGGRDGTLLSILSRGG
jgi:hypothetical protein